MKKVICHQASHLYPLENFTFSSLDKKEIKPSGEKKTHTHFWHHSVSWGGVECLTKVSSISSFEAQF